MLALASWPKGNTPPDNFAVLFKKIFWSWWNLSFHKNHTYYLEKNQSPWSTVPLVQRTKKKIPNSLRFGFAGNSVIIFLTLLACTGWIWWRLWSLLSCSQHIQSLFSGELNFAISTGCSVRSTVFSIFKGIAWSYQIALAQSIDLSVFMSTYFGASKSSCLL